MNTTTSPSISVIIPTYNRKNRLVNCVKSVLRAADVYQGYIQVVIVDDASTDGTDIEFKKELQNFRVRYIKNETNKLTTYCRNIGAFTFNQDTCKNPIDWFLFLDSDNEVDETIFENFGEFIATQPDNFGFVAALTYNIPENRFYSLGGKINWFTGRLKCKLKSFFDKAKNYDEIDDLNLPEFINTSLGIPNATFIKASAFRIVGGYNTIYGVDYEDDDIGMRLTNSGFIGGICTKLKTKHFHIDKTNKESNDPILRRLGVYTPRFAFNLTRNKIWFMKQFSPWYTFPFYLCTFAWIPGAYFALRAFMRKRPDCAFATLKGILAGIFTSPPPCKFN